MKRLFGLVVASALLVGGLVGCDKPSEEDCRKAIANMRTIHGTDDPTINADPDVRRCKGASSRKAVACAIAATTLEELTACGFTPKSAGSATPGGSDAPAPTGSAGADTSSPK